MALKDQAINLVLRARNLLSSDTDAAARSVDDLADSAEGLQGKLRELEDQKTLVKEFQQSEKAVDRASKAYERLQKRSEKMADKLENSSNVTQAQTREWYELQDAVAQSEGELKKAEKALDGISDEAESAGINIGDLNGEQRRLAAETTKARRAQADLNKTVEKSDGSFSKFRKTLSGGVSTFVKWGAAAGAAGAALTVGALTRFTSSQADLARQTLASADAFGISVGSLQRWQSAAESVGIGGEKVSDIMKDVAEKIGDAFLTGGGEAAEVIRGLNLDLAKLAALNPDEQILAIAKELEGMPKPAQIQILEALASDASLLLPLLDDNAAKLRELGDAAEERGNIFTEEELEELAAVNTAFREVTQRVSGFAKEIAIKLSPAFTEMAESIDKALSDKPELVDTVADAFTDLVEKTESFVNTIIDNGDAIGDTLGTVVDSVKGLGSTFEAVFRGVQAFGAGAGEVLARTGFSISSVIAAATRGLNKIGLASDDAVEKAEFRVQNFATSVQDLEQKSEQYKQQMIEAGSAAATSFGKAAEGAGSTAKAVAGAASEVVGLGNSAKDAARNSGELTEELGKVEQTQEGLKGKIEETAVALEAAGAALLANDNEANRAEVERLNGQYSELIGTLRELQETERNLANPTNTSDGTNAQGNQLADKYRESAEAITDTGDAAEDTSRKVEKVTDDVKESGEGVQQTGDKATEAAGSVGAAIGAIFNGWSNRLSALSAKAGAAFQSAIGGVSVEATSELERRLQGVNNLLDYTESVVRTNPISRMLGEWATAGFETEQAFLQQSIAAEKLTDRIIEGDISANALGRTAESVSAQFSLLDENQLRPLIGAIQSAQREVESLNDSLVDTIRSAEQELAALQGDTAEVERLRNQERQLELQEQLNKARALGDKEAIANAEKAIQLTEQAFQERQRQEAERTAQERERAAEQEARDADRRLREEAEERQDISRTEARGRANTTQLDRAISNRTVTLNFQAGGQNFGSVQGVDSNQVDQIIAALERAGLVAAG